MHTNIAKSLLDRDFRLSSCIHTYSYRRCYFYVLLPGVAFQPRRGESWQGASDRWGEMKRHQKARVRQGRDTKRGLVQDQEHQQCLSLSFSFSLSPSLARALSVLTHRKDILLASVSLRTCATAPTKISQPERAWTHANHQRKSDHEDACIASRCLRQGNTCAHKKRGWASKSFMLALVLSLSLSLSRHLAVLTDAVYTRYLA